MQINPQIILNNTNKKDFLGKKRNSPPLSSEKESFSKYVTAEKT